MAYTFAEPADPVLLSVRTFCTTCLQTSPNHRRSLSVLFRMKLRPQI